MAISKTQGKLGVPKLKTTTIGNSIRSKPRRRGKKRYRGQGK